MSPPERIGLVSVCSRRRSASFFEPADTSGTGGSRSSSIPSRLASFRSSSFQSMSFSVLSIFQLLTPELEPAMSVPLPAHQIGLIDVDRFPVMEQGDKNGQPDRSLRCGDGHHEKHKDEPMQLVELPCIGEKSEVDGIDHQLDGHEDRDPVLARQHTADADSEQDRAQDQKPLCRDHVVCTPRPLKTSAPTIAASRRMETISKGKMYDSKRVIPIVRASARKGPAGSCITAYFAR